MVDIDDVTLSRAQRIYHKTNELLDEHVFECDQCLMYQHTVDSCSGYKRPSGPCSECIRLDVVRARWYRTVEFLKHVEQSRTNS